MILTAVALMNYFILQSKFNRSERAYRQLRQEGDYKSDDCNNSGNGDNGGGYMVV